MGVEKVTVAGSTATITVSGLPQLVNVVVKHGSGPWLPAGPPLVNPTAGTHTYPLANVQPGDDVAAGSSSPADWHEATVPTPPPLPVPSPPAPVPSPSPQPPPEPAPSGANRCLPGLCMNGDSAESMSVRAAKVTAVGGRVGRIAGSVAELAAVAVEHNMQVCPILGSQAEIEAVGKLDATHKAAVIAACWRNECWPGGIGHQMTGAAYGAEFVNMSKAARQVGLRLLCQVNITPADPGKWQGELLRTPGLADALAGMGLDHHPYGNSMMTPLADPSNPFDQSHGWESRRWMSEAWSVQHALGHAPFSCLTELGPSLTKDGTWANVVAKDAAIFQFLTLVKHGQVPAAERPGGTAYTPEVLFATWYSLVGNRTGFETFGVYFYPSEGGPNEEDGRFAKWKAGAGALVAA